LSYTFPLDCPKMDIVECHSDFTYAEKPVAFLWNNHRLKVDAILASWNSPGERCFRVITSGRGVFDLIYDEATAEWQIQPISGG
jgi:hypothetical protein